MSPTAVRSAGLSSREKGMIAVAVVAVLLALLGMYRTFSPDQGHAAAKIHLPMDAMPKGRWMQAQKAGQGTSNVPVTGGAGASIPVSDASQNRSGQ